MIIDDLIKASCSFLKHLSKISQQNNKKVTEYFMRMMDYSIITFYLIKFFNSLIAITGSAIIYIFLVFNIDFTIKCFEFSN